MSDPIKLTEAEWTAIQRAIQAAVNYHSFDALLEMADFDVADALCDTETAGSAPGGLSAAVEAILTARRAEWMAEAWDEGYTASSLGGFLTPNPYRVEEVGDDE